MPNAKLVSAVVRTAEVDGPLEVAGRHGASVRYRQHCVTGEIVIDGADLAPVFGMAVTLLATDLPDQKRPPVSR
jgi:hypothetical protein